MASDDSLVEFLGSPPATILVNKKAQALTFTSTPPTDAKVGDTYTVTANGGASGLPMTFSVDTSTASVCSIHANVVTLMASGSCRINANQAGNDTYQAAAQQQQSLGADLITLNASITSSLNPSQVGDNVSFTVNLNESNTFKRLKNAAITGDITLSSNGSPLGTAAVVNGVATLNVTFPTAGQHTMLATYSDNSRYASAQATLVQTVNAAAAPGNISSIPTLGAWSMLMLSGLLGALGAGVMRKPWLCKLCLCVLRHRLDGAGCTSMPWVMH